MTAQETLTTAATTLRAHGSPTDALLADLLEAAVADFELVDRINSRDPDNDGKTRIMAHPIAQKALAYANAILNY